MIEGFDPHRTADLRREARRAAAAAGEVRRQTIRVLEQSRRLAEAASRQDAARLLESRFAALPAAAAVLDPDAYVIATNLAWRALPEVGDACVLGSHFPSVWCALTDDAYVAEAVSAVITTRTPAQIETTSMNPEWTRRFLLQLGAARLSDGRSGALVVIVDITQQYEREVALLHQASHDPLTGVANRAALDLALQVALDRLRRYDEPFAVIYADLDRFKAVNDRLGHAVGDVALREVAGRWQGLVRAPDLLARVGGDEFVVVVQHATDESAAAALSGRFAAILAEPFTIDEHRLVVTVTTGIAVPTPLMTPEEAIATADRAMYVSKVEHRKPT